MTRFPRFACLVFAGALACNDNAPEPVPPVDTILVVEPDAISLTAGASQQLAAVLVVADTDTVAVAVLWTSRDGAVATVDGTGLVSAADAGVTHVVAEFETRADSAEVTVMGAPPQTAPALELITDALSAPVHAAAPPGDQTRLFVVQQGGVIRILRNDTLLATPFLDINTLVSKGGEQGLLSMAFHPAYATNGFVYVSYTDVAGTSKVVRYTVSNPETANPATAFQILSVNQPYPNHNGGLITFGPDGMLYVALGDGGSGGDPDGNGQNTATLLGSLLRIDVDGGSPYAIPPDNPFVGQPPARGEVWAYGLRNPWRFAFDRSTGDLYVADVGQSAREEVNAVAAPVPGGLNYGWNIMEGFTCYNAATCSQAGLTLPILDYRRADGCSVIGGFVYRGVDVPQLAGRYLYSDLCGGWLRSVRYANGRVTDATEWPGLAPGPGVTSFAEDARGEVYVMTGAGSLYRIVLAVP